MAEHLTDKLGRIPHPKGGNQNIYDDEARGLGLRITAAGARVWIFNYRTKAGIERRLTIGDAGRWEDDKWRAGAWTLRAARVQRELRRQVDAGQDPMGDLHAKRKAPTMNELAGLFEAEHLPRKRPGTPDEYRRLLRIHIRPALGGRKVAELRHHDIEAMHRKIAATAPYAANRAVAVVSKMLSLAVNGSCAPTTRPGVWNARPRNGARDT